MNFSLRNQRCKVYAYTDAGTDGVINSLYVYQGEYWCRIDDSVGQEITLGDGAEHHVDATFTFGPDVTVPTDAVIKYDDRFYKVLSALTRTQTREVRVATTFCESDTISYSETGSITTYTPTPFSTDLFASTASYALVAQTLLGTITSASYALTASYVPGASIPDWTSITNKPVGIVSSSVQINTGSFTGSFTGGLNGTASFAGTTWTSVNNRPVGLVSSSQQVNTGSFTGSLTGTLQGSASYAPSAWDDVSNVPVGLVSASTQINTGSFTGSFTGNVLGSASYAPTSWNNVNNKPVGIVSSSTQVNTGSFSGSFVGSASYAPTAWDDVSNIPVGLVSSSIQINTGSFTGSFTGGLLGTSSWAISASWAPGVGGTADWDTITNKPGGIVSASAQINTGSFTGSFTGNVQGSSSYAPTSWNSINNVPVGLVSASAQINTGSFTGSFTGGFRGTASYAVSAAYAPGGGTPDWSTITNIPVGLVSSSVQINTGSFTGSFTGGLQGTASWAVSSSWAPSAGSTPTYGTGSYPLMMNIFPDTSNECWSEPASIQRTNDTWNHRVMRFGSASNIQPAVKTGFYGAVNLPHDIAESASVELTWTSNITSGDVAWMLEYTIASSSMNLDSAMIHSTTTKVDTAPASAFGAKVLNFSITSSHLTNGQILRYRLSRDGTAGSDTLAGSTTLDDLTLHYIRAL